MKDILRKEYINRRKEMDADDKSQADHNIFGILKNHPDLKNNTHIMTYVSTKDEVDTYNLMEHLLKEQKVLYVPVVINNDIQVSILNDINDLSPGKFDIGEPEKTKQNFFDPAVLEVVIVPGVCFTYEGARLGRGGGYYDRFLKKISKDAAVIGICYSFQVLERVPNDLNDFRVKEVITEKNKVGGRSEKLELF